MSNESEENWTCGVDGWPHTWVDSGGGVRCETCGACISARAYENFRITCAVLGELVFEAAMEASRRRRERS